MSAQEKTAGGLSRRNLWAYPVGTVGRDMAGCMFTNYLLTYVLFTKTLTSVQFACISVIMVAALLLAAYFIYRVKYTITEESYEAMVRDIEVRRAAKGETAE